MTSFKPPPRTRCRPSTLRRSGRNSTTILLAEYQEARTRAAHFIAQVNAEDVSIVERVQRGRHSPAFDGGQFVPAQEATSLHFQKMVAAAITTPEPERAQQIVALETRDINREA